MMNWMEKKLLTCVAIIRQQPVNAETAKKAQRKSQGKMKSKTITRIKTKNRPEKDKQTDDSEENKAMMCWENLKDSMGKESYEETDDEEKNPVKEMQEPKDEEEHVDSTLQMGN